MANGIVLTSAIRQNLLTLQATTEMQGKIQERLSTGKKVNSALDNPTNFFTAASLNRRATDLSALLDGMANGIKTLESADNAMKSITKTVETMRAYVQQARQDKSFKAGSYTVDTAAIGTTTVKNLTFSGGAVGTTPVNVAVNSIDAGGSATTQQTSSAYSSPAAATAGAWTSTGVNFAATTFTDALDSLAFDLTVDGTVHNITIDQATLTAAGSADATLDDVTELNALLADQGATGVTASLVGGKLTFTSSTTGASSAVTVTNFVETDADTDTTDTTGLSAGTATGGAAAESLDFTVNGTAVTVAAGRTLAQAVSDINTTLGGSHAFEAFDNGGNLQIRAKAVGVTALTIAGADSGLFAAASNGTAPTTLGAVKTVDQLVTDINATASLTGKVRASNDGGKLRIENLSTEAMTVVGATATGVNGGTTLSDTQTVGGNEIRKNLITQFNELRGQLDKLASDASFNGVNLLKADKLKVTFNEIGTSVLEIQATGPNGAVRGIDTGAASLNIGAANALEFSSDTLLEARLESLSDAMTVVQTQSSSFGSSLSIMQVRQEFTKSMINTLEVGADNLTLADANEEGANLLALNTRQQLSQTALSLAAQAQQAVLRLFG